MQGPEWNVTGRLKDWDVTDRLTEIAVPALVTSGRHDEMTPELVRRLVDGLRDSTWHVFEHSAHMAHIEEEQEFLSVVESFLAAHD